MRTTDRSRHRHDREVFAPLRVRAALCREVAVSLVSRRDRFFARIDEERGLSLLPVAQRYENTADTHGVLEREGGDECAGAIHFGGVRRNNVEHDENIHVGFVTGFPTCAEAV